MTSAQTVGLLLLPLVLVLFNRARQSKRGKLPPGPPGHPVLGHLLVFPQKQAEKQLYEWSKTYGDVMYFSILGMSLAVVSSRQAAVDLLDKRGAIYSDRPEFPTLALLGWDNQLVTLPFGESFHKQRKFIQRELSHSECLAFRPIQLEQTRVLLKDLLRDPGNFELLLRKFNVAVNSMIIFGRRVDSPEDGIMELAEILTVVQVEISKAGVVQLFPSLKHLPSWFPGAWYIRYAQEKRPSVDRIIEEPFADCLKQIADGVAQPCIVSKHLDKMDKNDSHYEEELQLLKVAAGHMWLAGEETTWSSLSAFLLAIVIHPETARKAQAEIDKVTGGERLPTFDDYDSLPYLSCLIQEAFRMHSALPIGIPHRAMEDDVYRDMFIPKGTSIIVNTMALALDPTVYKDPHKFWPERYLPENGSEPHPTGFGYGRRICPGRYLAEASIWIAAANILAVFDVTPVKDAQGRDEIPEAKFMEGLASHPEPFHCNIRPRSKEAEALILQS